LHILPFAKGETMPNYKWKKTSSNTCPSCEALNGQVRTRWTIQPADHRLYCQSACHCKLEETDEPESGDLSMVPLRKLQENNDMKQDLSLKALATPTQEGFDILAISEGEAKGHGITFSGAVLQDGLHLYNNKPVFIDHAGLYESPSVRDLAGTIASPGWNNIERGITVKLRPSGPAKDILLAVRDAARADPAIMEAVGFSTVLNVQLDTKGNVTKIVRVKSVDVVIDPARGGKFLQAKATHHAYPYQGQKGDNHMTDHNEESALALTEQQQAALELQGVSETIADLKAKNEQANQILLAQCRALLDSSLAASKLPGASQKAVRKPFENLLAEGRPFTPTELQEAIKEKRDELSELNQGQVQGPARVVSGVFNTEDQLQAAIDDLLGAPRDEDKKNLKVARLSGIREAYLIATGDRDFFGGFFPEFALVTANFPKLVKNAINKVLANAWAQYGAAGYNWWEKIVTVDHFDNLQQIDWLITGTIGSLPTVAEREEYTELPLGDNGETSDWSKYGGYVPITLEAILRDDVRGLKTIGRELALAGLRNISEQVSAIFTSNSGAGPTLSDTGALFNATAVTTAGGHANLLTTAIGTDFTAWDAVAAAVYNQPMLRKNDTGYYGTGKKQAVEPLFCLVPRALKAAAEALFIPRWAGTVDAAIAAKGGPTYGGFVQPITVPEWTDATDWAAVVDPNLVPGIMLGEIFGVKPQVFVAGSEMDPAMFANDESRLKVRQFLTVGIANWRALHKSNVA
jgi:hypothetical protein